ncbi:hypothetical protein GGI15_004191 [Coemansia interrupta]|uniref:Uncharacterized protein n=1 Tax=Coemansia interrupta TaxID=1126814 RepID=A0A9W8H532_9FUNG|nr:hypothetical protein GGI15_004191 [Coemansia interrupta]
MAPSDAPASEQLLRTLDACLQEWAAIHRQSLAAGSSLASLHAQRQKALALTPADHQLLFALHEQTEATLGQLRRHANAYARVAAQLRGLAAVSAADGSDDPLARMAGITAEYAEGVVGERCEAYGAESERRCGLLEKVVWAQGDVARFADEWAACHVDYAVEEEYLDRLRCLRLARQWHANREIERLHL